MKRSLIYFSWLVVTLGCVPPALADLILFDVDVSQPWQDTGVDLLAGDLLTITVDPTERVIFGVGGTFGVRTITADGIGDEGVGSGRDGTEKFPTAILPDAIVLSLIGKIGGTSAIGTGVPLPEALPGKGAGFVGSLYSFVVPISGRLFLGFNDEVGLFSDNTGVFSTQIETTQVSAVPEPSSLLLLGLGMTVLGVSSRHRRLW